MNEDVILLAMCDHHLADIYRRRLEADGWRVELAEDSEEIERKVSRFRPVILLVDVDCVADITALVKKIRRMPTMLKSKIALYSDVGDTDRIRSAHVAGAHAFILLGHLTPAEVVQKMNALLQA